MQLQGHQQQQAKQQQKQKQQEEQPQLPVQLTSVLAAAAVAISCIVPVGPAEARPRMTPDETVTIDVFKKTTPSVVNVTNLAARWGLRAGCSRAGLPRCRVDTAWSC